MCDHLEEVTRPLHEERKQGVSNVRLTCEEMIPKKWAFIPFTYLQLVGLCTNIYIVPQLLVSKICHKTFNNTVCSQLGQPKFKSQEDYVFGKAAEWNALVNFAGLLPSTVLLLPLGSMTDLVSKQKLLLVPAIASLLSSLINLFSSIYITVHEGFLVLASFITSIYGDEPGLNMLCCAYSVSAWSDNRLLAVVLVYASNEAGLATGNLVSNYMTRYFGYSSAFLLATVALATDLLYALIVIPPVDDEDRKPPAKEHSDALNDFKEHTKETWLHLVSFGKEHFLNSTDRTIPLLLVAAFFNFGERALITLFLKHSPLSLLADEIGVYLTLFQLSRTLGLICLAFVLNRYFQLSDYTIMIIGAMSKIVKYTFLSFSTTKLMVYLSTILSFPATFMSSAVSSQLTKLVAKEEHGISLSLSGLLSGSSILVMSVGANGLFAATAKIYSGFSILLMSFSNLISLIILYYVICTKKHNGTATNEASMKESDKDFKQDDRN